MPQIKKRFLREEAGQSIIEFALLLPVLILLVLAPVDFFRYALMKMNLESAAAEAINQVTEAEWKTGSAEAAVRKVLDNAYAGAFPDVRVEVFPKTAAEVQNHLETNRYTYYVYSSKTDDYEERPSNYSYCEATVTLSCRFTPITWIGAQYFQDDAGGVTAAAVKDILMDGYDPAK